MKAYIHAFQPSQERRSENGHSEERAPLITPLLSQNGHIGYASTSGEFPTAAVGPPSTPMTVDEALCYIGVGPFQALMLFVLGFSYMADAGEALFLSFLGPDVKCEWNLSGTEESVITMVVFLGMAIGSIVFGTIADFFGRKPAAISDVVSTAFAGLISALAPNYWALVMCRFLVGIGLGGFVLVLSMYSEFLPIDNRGKTLAVYQVFWSVGACFEVAIAWLVMPHFQWRGLAVASALPLVALMLVLPFIPESPRFLVVAGKEKKALEVLNLIARVNGKSLPDDIRLQKVTRDDDIVPGSEWTRFVNQFRKLVRHPLGRITRIVWPIWIMAALGYYSIVILTTSVQADNETPCNGNHVEFSNEDYRDILIDASGEIPGVLLAMFMIDGFGRKKTLMFGWYGCAISLLCLPIATMTQTFFLFSARFFIMYLFAVVLVMVPELYPSSCRSFAMGTGNFVSRSGAAVAPFLAQAVYDAYGLEVVTLVHGILFLAIGTFSTLIPFETSGKPMTDTLEDLQNEMERPQQNSLAAVNGVIGTV